MNWTVRSIFLFILIVSFRCTLEEAQPQDLDELVIVSDYLNAMDSSLFDEFSEAFDIHIRIVDRSADDIIGDFRNKGYGTGYDVVMLKSLYDVNRFAKYEFFHDMDELTKKNQYSSDKFDFVGFGVDPYVFAFNDDSTLLHHTYSDLLSTSYTTNLAQSDKIPMLAFIMSKLQKERTYEWLQNFESKRSYQVSSNSTLLSSYSSYATLNKHDSTYMHINSVYFPNQSGKGAFYNLRTFAIVDQAESYNVARSFIDFYLREQQNQKLCNDLHVFGIQNSIRLQYEETDRLLPYYGMIERMLNRLK